MADLLILETGNGGDLVIKGNDLAMVEGVENMPYLSMFGGNVAWWGNNLLLSDSDDIQFSSESEQSLLDISLNSAGRVALENAIKRDLAALKTNSKSALVVSVAFVSNDKISIEIDFNGEVITLYWNPDQEYLTYKI